MLVDGFEELANYKGDRLDALDFLLRTNKLPLEVGLLVLDVALLYFEHLEMSGESFVRYVQVLLVELLHQSDLFGEDRLESGFLFLYLDADFVHGRERRVG